MTSFLIFMDPCIVVWLSRNNQQDATQFPFRLDYGRSPHAYVNQRLQIQLELLMISSVPLETCSAFNERWSNKFYYKVASCWLFLLSLSVCLVSNIRFQLLQNHDRASNLQLAIFVQLISVYSDVTFVSSYTHIRLMTPASKIEVVLGFYINPLTPN